MKVKCEDIDAFDSPNMSPLAVMGTHITGKLQCFKYHIAYLIHKFYSSYKFLIHNVYKDNICSKIFILVRKYLQLRIEKQRLGVRYNY